jgi:nucleoside-diphosphate-sugar epimerase
MTLDISRARDELGYRPRIGMDEALARTFAGLVGDAA